MTRRPLCLAIHFTRDTPLPVQHLALGYDHTEMVVSWLTSSPSASTVKFGDGSEDVRVTVGETLVYTVQSIPRNTSSFANYTSGMVHHARLTNLLPDTQYFYQVGPPVPTPSLTDAQIPPPPPPPHPSTRRSATSRPNRPPSRLRSPSAHLWLEDNALVSRLQSVPSHYLASNFRAVQLSSSLSWATWDKPATRQRLWHKCQSWMMR